MRIEMFLPLEKIASNKFKILEEVNKILDEELHSGITLHAMTKLLNITPDKPLTEMELVIVKSKLIQATTESFAENGISLEINDFEFKVIND